MRTEDNKKVVRRQFDLISAGDAAGAASLYAPLSLNHGREVSRQDLAGVFEGLASQEERFSVREMVAEGEWVACRAEVTGKHDRKPGIPIAGGLYDLAEPEGQVYMVQHLHLFRVVDGLIVEHWANRDDLGAARQLGLELRPKERKEETR